MKVITNFTILLQYARDLAKAESSGDKEMIEKAHKKHEEYKQLCLDSDEMSLSITRGQL